MTLYQKSSPTEGVVKCDMYIAYRPTHQRPCFRGFFAAWSLAASPDQTLVIGKRHVAGCCSVPMVIGDDLNFPIHEHTYTWIGCS